MADLTKLREKYYDEAIETERDSHISKLETFETYAARKKAQLSSTDDDYLRALRHGYEVIMLKMASKGMPIK